MCIGVVRLLQHSASQQFSVYLKWQNVNLLMMGTADALPIEPVAKTTFVEDLTENQLAKAVMFVSCFLKFAFKSILRHVYDCYICFVCKIYCHLYISTHVHCIKLLRPLVIFTIGTF